MQQQHSDSATQAIGASGVDFVIHRKSPYLVVCAGRDTGKRFELEEDADTTIGRDSEATIVIDDERISRIHCVVTASPAGISVADRGSRNGTFVEGERIDKAPLTVEASLQIGQTVMRLEYKDKLEHDFEDDLLRNATLDSLTGLPNRHYFMRRAREGIPLARRLGFPVGVVMLDIDHVKQINDSYGHRAGDYVISQTASLICADKRGEDLVGRYGGDELIIMLRGKLDLAGGITSCERVRRNIEAFEFSFGGGRLPVTITLGLCVGAAREPLCLEDLVARANKALYRAKQAGCNRVAWDV